MFCDFVILNDYDISFYSKLRQALYIIFQFTLIHCFLLKSKMYEKSYKK